MTRIAGAKVIGGEHRRRDANAQDAFFVATTPDGFVLVVSDGCGSTRAAEVGAALTAEIAGAFALARLSRGDAAAAVVARTGRAVLERLARVASSVPRARRAAFVEDHLMATLLLAVGTAQDVAVAAWGDGTVCVDGDARAIDEDGAPRYLAHALLGDDGAGEPGHLWVSRRARVDRIAVATDGLSPAQIGGAFGLRGRGVPRWLNALGAARALADDAAVALAEEVSS